MLPRQTQYSVTEKECLAVVEAVRHFEAYLLGTSFQLVTDHKALLALGRTTSGGARIIRWALALQPFRYSIIHRPGSQHGNADGLSRQAWPEVTDTQQEKDLFPSGPGKKLEGVMLGLGAGHY